MAEDTVEKVTTKLSHKLFKRLLQKEKRKIKRQIAAEARHQEENAEQRKVDENQEYREKVEAEKSRQEKMELLERERNVKLWLQREAEFDEKNRQRREDEERRKKQKEEQERKIKLEWERQQAKENEEKEKKEKASKEKEEALFREIEKEPNINQETFHNPSAPVNYGTEKDVVNCSFFLKTGACRFSERCSRHHPRPASSVTLLIPGMYADIRHIESALDIADRDTGLEFDEQDAFAKFVEFYDDVYPEFQKSGRVVQFKVCCNYEPHLRGNVYVQYTSEDDCQKAFAHFNGRWYAGRQLSCEFSPVTNWKSAICGLFHQNRCPRGKNCNFLHVYNNPDEYDEQRDENRRYHSFHRHNNQRHQRGPSNGWSRDRWNDRNEEERYYKRRRKHRRRSDSSSSDGDNNQRSRYRRQSKEHRDTEEHISDDNNHDSLRVNNDYPETDYSKTTSRSSKPRRRSRTKSRSRSRESDDTSNHRHHKSKKKHKKHRKRRHRDRDESE